MKKSITQKYPAKAESILPSCFVIKPATNNKLEYCEAKDVLWDTGATNTIISRNIADALGLEPIQKVMIAGIGGNVEAYTYKISLYFAKEGAWIKDLEVLACDLEDNDIIIGMDTITRGDLAITNKNGETWFSFRIPSQEHIEFE